MKKTLFTLSLVALAGIMVACGGTSSATNSSSSETPTSSATSTSSATTSNTTTSNPTSSVTTGSSTTSSTPAPEALTTADVKAMADGTKIDSFKGVVAAKNNRSLILQDAEGFVAAYCYGEKITNIEVGDYVEVGGTASKYNVVIQIQAEDNVKVLAETAPTYTLPAITAWDADDVTAYAAAADDLHYVSFENVEVRVDEGAKRDYVYVKVGSNEVELADPLNFTYSTGDFVNVKGFVVGYQGGNVQMVYTELTDGEDPNPEPPFEGETLTITPTTLDDYEQIVMSRVTPNEEYVNEFTMAKNGSFIKSSNITEIQKIEVHVYGTFDYLKMYDGVDASGTEVSHTSVSEGQGVRYTYTFADGTNNFYLVNPSTYNVQLFEIVIYYTGELTDYVPPVEPAIQDVTIAEAVAINASKNDKLYRVTGVLTDITNTEYGSGTLVDPATGDSITLYGLWSEADNAFAWNGTNYDYENPKTFSTLDVQAGDKITVVGVLEKFNTTMEIMGYLDEKVDGETLTYTASIDVNDDTMGSATLSKVTGIAFGEEVTVNITPTAGYKVSTVTINGASAEKVSDTEYKFTASAYNEVVVTFMSSSTVVTSFEITADNLGLQSGYTSNENTGVNVTSNGLTYTIAYNDLMKSGSVIQTNLSGSKNSYYYNLTEFDYAVQSVEFYVSANSPAGNKSVISVFTGDSAIKSISGLTAAGSFKTSEYIGKVATVDVSSANAKYIRVENTENNQANFDKIVINFAVDSSETPTPEPGPDDPTPTVTNNVEVNATNLQLGSYGNGEATITYGNNTVDFSYNQLMKGNGDTIQGNAKKSPISALWNTTAFSKAVTSIDIDVNDWNEYGCDSIGIYYATDAAIETTPDTYNDLVTRTDIVDGVIHVDVEVQNVYFVKLQIIDADSSGAFYFNSVTFNLAK